MEAVLLIANYNDRSTIVLKNIFRKKNIKTIIMTNKNKRFTNLLIYPFKKQIRTDYNNATQMVNNILKVKSKYEKLHVYSFGDPSTKILLDNYDLLEQNNIVFSYNKNINIYNKLTNKEVFLDYIKNFDLKSAERYNSVDVDHIPFVIKPKIYTKLDKVLKVPILIRSKEQYSEMIKMNLNYEHHFIERYIEGDSLYYCAYYIDGFKKDYYVQHNLKQQPNGGSIIKARLGKISNETMKRLDKMFSKINYTGPTMVEIRKENESEYIIECNARYWGPLQLGYKNGHSMTSFNEEYIQLKKPEKEVGYKWIGGYIKGASDRIKSNDDFLTYNNFDPKIKYNDAWFTISTIGFYFLEILKYLILFMITKIKRIFK